MASGIGFFEALSRYFLTTSTPLGNTSLYTGHQSNPLYYFSLLSAS